jgi:hypothetical protein
VSTATVMVALLSYRAIHIERQGKRHRTTCRCAAFVRPTPLALREHNIARAGEHGVGQIPQKNIHVGLLKDATKAKEAAAA